MAWLCAHDWAGVPKNILGSYHSVWVCSEFCLHHQHWHNSAHPPDQSRRDHLLTLHQQCKQARAQRRRWENNSYGHFMMFLLSHVQFNSLPPHGEIIAFIFLNNCRHSMSFPTAAMAYTSVPTHEKVRKHFVQQFPDVLVLAHIQLKSWPHKSGTNIPHAQINWGWCIFYPPAEIS